MTIIISYKFMFRTFVNSILALILWYLILNFNLFVTVWRYRHSSILQYPRSVNNVFTLQKKKVNRGSSLAEQFPPKPTQIVLFFSSSSSSNLKIKRILINSMKHQIQQHQQQQKTNFKCNKVTNLQFISASKKKWKIIIKIK